MGIPHLQKQWSCFINNSCSPFGQRVSVSNTDLFHFSSKTRKDPHQRIQTHTLVSFQLLSVTHDQTFFNTVRVQRPERRRWNRISRRNINHCLHQKPGLIHLNQ
ncbi:hypothetical protein Hanom_Chr17g01584061 [Helianthus anomalus]